MSITAPNVTSSQIAFFDYLFDKQEGYLCLATTNPDLKKSHAKHFEQRFFSWPEQIDEISYWLKAKTSRKNVYYCTSLLEQPKRLKEFCLPSRLVWSDLDYCDPAIVTPVPSNLIQSSVGKYQAIWRLDAVLDTFVQEDYSKRLAYKYKDNGADINGWDLTQLLRVPYTYNYNHETPGIEPPQVDIVRSYDTYIEVGVFEEMPPPGKDSGYTGSPLTNAESTLPDEDQLQEVKTITYKYMTNLGGTGWRNIFTTEPKPEEDWSSILWKFLNMCFEAGMDKFEVYAVAREAACNKYARDNRPDIHLWADVLNAEEAQIRASLTFGYRELLTMPDIVAGEQTDDVTSFVDDYYDWAVAATDAIPIYHELCAFILLSSVMASGLRLKTSYGDMYPNLWGLVLGDSTLTRKTTAMSMAMNMLVEVDSNVILASDGSVEGILTGLSERPNRTSVFFRDEITGFLDAVHRKDYLAGITETFTHLYDVPRIYPRRLRKETITIVSPVFIFFGGGIRDKVYSLLTDESVLSGFIPRFLVVSGESDLAKIRRTGPNIVELSDQRDVLQRRITDLYERFNRSGVIRIGGQEVDVPQYTFATLSEDAWARYGDIESTMVETAHKSSMSMMALPTFERLSRSLLKMALLLAAADNSNPTGVQQELVVEAKHISKAASYVQRWGNYTIELVMATGKTNDERTLDKILHTITKHPGILRGQVMRLHALTSKQATDILTTLEDRGHITMEKAGRGHKLKAV